MRGAVAAAVTAHPNLNGSAGEQRPAAARQRGRGVGAGHRAAGRVHRRRAVGRGVPHAQPPVRRARADGGADLRRRRAGRRRGTRARELLPASRDHGEVMRRSAGSRGRCDRSRSRCDLGVRRWLLACARRRAFNPVKPICGVAGWVSGLAGKACGVIQHGDKLVGRQEARHRTHRRRGQDARLQRQPPRSRRRRRSGLAASARGCWAAPRWRCTRRPRCSGARPAPQLGSTWFSSTYWRMAGIAAVLTLPFLFAAAVQALIRSDLALLARAALGYLPLSLLAVSVAAPLTMLLLAASDRDVGDRLRGRRATRAPVFWPMAAPRPAC